VDDFYIKPHGDGQVSRGGNCQGSGKCRQCSFFSRRGETACVALGSALLYIAYETQVGREGFSIPNQVGATLPNKWYKKGMSKQSIEAPAPMEGTPQSEQLFLVEKEYARCVNALTRAGILTLLPKSESMGVIGHDGYVKYVEHLRSGLVPTGWWHRDFGRVRLDAHRPGNRRCTRSWGGSSTVRLIRP